MAHWVNSPDHRTDALTGLAEALIALRSTFRTNDGDVDWRGRSWDYRQHVGGLYERAGVSEGDRQHIQAAVRYHVGNKLRESLTPEQLENADMLTTSPKDRLNTQRTMGNILLGQRTGAQPLWRLQPESSRAWLLSVKALTVAVEQVEELDPTRLPASAKNSVGQHLADVCERLVSVVERLE
jgi:hypothetical protein